MNLTGNSEFLKLFFSCVEILSALRKQQIGTPVLAHSGSIEIESSEGKGCTFRIVLSAYNPN